MKDTFGKWHKGVSVLISISILCGVAIRLDAQDVVIPQGNRAVTSLAIVDVEGDAEVLSKVDLERSRGQARILAEAWKPATPRSLLSSGDQLRTGARGSLTLQLNDGTLVTLGGDTVAAVEDLRSARGESPQTVQIKLEQGRLTTEQTTKILGQTRQLIRTDNGLINTSLGEVEVWKPSMEVPQLAMLGSLPTLAQKPPKNETRVMHQRGGATISASGVGRMIASSMFTPETCIDEDGLKFTLQNPDETVTITRLEDENAVLLTSKKEFYLLVATEGTANIVDIITQDSGAKLDIEGINVAEQDANALARVKLHPLLTVGVQTYAVKIKFGCDEAESRGLNDFSIQAMSGNVNVERTGFGMGSDRPDPSGGSGAGAFPRGTPTPSPTPTPTTTPEEDEDEFPTPTPTMTPTEVPVGRPAPTPVPVTHTFSRNPTLQAITADPGVLGHPLCSDPNEYYVRFRVEYENYLPSIMGGQLIFRLADNLWQPYSPNYKDIPGELLPPMIYNYSANQQLETGTLQSEFCYIPLAASGNELRFTVQVFDWEGNSSGTPKQCLINDVAVGGVCP